MGYRILVSLALVFAAFGAFAQSGPEADAGTTASAQGSAAEAAIYPETPEGLKKLLQDVFEAENAGDTAKSERLYASMAIPDHAVWFVKTFGEAEGARLEAKYKGQEDATSSSGSPPMRVKLGGDVAKPKLIHRVDPTYPAEASRQGIQGTVRLHVVLAKDGSVRQMEVVSGDPLLAQAAMDAVKQWRYKPTTLNGEPVEVDTQVEVFFGRRK